MISLQNILSQSRYSDFELLTDANRTDLDRPIKSVEISETPDIEFYIPEGVLLLTTAMNYQEDQSELKTLIDSLIRKKAAGLGIKTGRFLHEVDPHVLAYAEQMKFPIFNIPDQYSLGSVLHQLLNMLWDTQYEEVNFALDIQKRFSNLLIRGADNQQIINNLSQIVETPILLLNPFKQVMAHSAYFAESKHPPAFYAEQVTQALDASNKESGYFTITNPKGDNMQSYILPIKVHMYFPYYLIVLKPELIPYPVSTFAIQQAAMVLTFMLYKNEMVADSEESFKTDFFKDLISYAGNDNHKHYEPNIKYGYIHSDYYQIIHVHQEATEDHPASKLYVEELYNLVAHWLTVHLDQYFKHAICIHFKSNQESILLLQYPSSNLKHSLENMNKDISHVLPTELLFSIGNAYNDWNDIQQSYVEASFVFNEREHYALDDRILFYQNNGIKQLLSHLDNEEVRFYCESILKELAQPTTSVNRDLRDTLKVYLAFQSEISRTAKHLFIHRNTVKYRIERCEEILGFSLNDPENTLAVRLALELCN